jgi:hypothetical protein
MVRPPRASLVIAVSALFALACGSRTGLELDGPFDLGAGADADGSTLGSGDDGGPIVITSDGGLVDAPGDDDASVGVDASTDDPPPPRLVAPLSTATVTTQLPTLHWVLAPGTSGAHIEICGDRACSNVVASYDAKGASGAPPDTLAPGVFFWRAFGRAKGRVGHTPSRTWQFIVGARSAAVDTSWGTTFDANGDGFADALIGSADLGSGSPNTTGLGHAYVFPGGASGLATKPAWSFAGPSINSMFGTQATSAGDVNGDGFSDAIVGAPGTGGYAGSAYVFLGGASGLATSPAVVLSGAQAGGLFGGAVSSAGDVNGDGYADVIVGAEDFRDPKNLGQFVGRAYLYLGSASGIATTPSATLISPGTISESFGGSVASAGDLDGDGYADVLVSGGVGIMQESTSFTVQGTVFVYRGGPGGLGAPVILPFPTAVGADSVSLTNALDLNGDGFADVVAGDEGSLVAFFGGPGGIPTKPSIAFDPQGPANAYSYRVGCGADFDGDGYGDFLAMYDHLYVYLGSATGPSTAPAAIVTPPGPSPGIYGYAPTGAADFDGDGYADALISSPSDTMFTGRVYVFPGSASGLPSAPARSMPGLDGPGGDFGGQ